MFRLAIEPGLVLGLDTPATHVGRQIRIIETVPASFKDLVVSVAHSAVKTNEYDEIAGKMVRLRIPATQTITGGPLSGLPENVSHFHGAILQTWTPGRQGLAFKFVTTETGVYEISARWKILETGEWIVSRPVVLTVMPAE